MSLHTISQWSLSTGEGVLGHPHGMGLFWQQKGEAK